MEARTSGGDIGVSGCANGSLLGPKTHRRPVFLRKLLQIEEPTPDLSVPFSAVTDHFRPWCGGGVVGTTTGRKTLWTGGREWGRGTGSRVPAGENPVILARSRGGTEGEGNRSFINDSGQYTVGTVIQTI